jgi:hypothetical protein
MVYERNVLQRTVVMDCNQGERQARGAKVEQAVGHAQVQSESLLTNLNKATDLIKAVGLKRRASRATSSN